MIRKLVLALGATAAIAGFALTPTTASAFGWHPHWHHWHHGFGIYAPIYAGAPDCYVVKQPVKTPFGWRMRRVTVCD
jgi:hypothetical protein